MPSEKDINTLRCLLLAQCVTMQCEKCHQETFLPFTCPYCGGRFCSQHRLPESHDCARMDLARAQKLEIGTKPQRQEYYEYTITYGKGRRPAKMSFNFREIVHLVGATLLVFGVGLSLVGFPRILSEPPALLGLLAAIVTVSFLTHEIAHKAVAQSKGMWAEFRLTLIGALLTILSMISPFLKVIAPGAVVVSGKTDRDTLGKTSLAGPVTNIIFSAAFLTAFRLTQTSSDLAVVFLIGAVFNGWISLINLIPFGILDGQKVFAWNRVFWMLSFSASLVLTAFSVWFYSQTSL